MSKRNCAQCVRNEQNGDWRAFPLRPTVSTTELIAEFSAIVIAGSDQGPAGVGLALDIGGGCIVLSVQRVELLVEPMIVETLV